MDECYIYFSNQKFDLCCICLDECILNEKNKISKEHDFINFKCCNGLIHQRCLLLMFINDFENCCLCRREIDVLDYYSINDIKSILNIYEMKEYKRELYKLLYKLSVYKIIYYIYVLILNIKIFFYNVKCWMFTCMLRLKMFIKRCFTF
jgi:hypothetical protein